MVQSIKSLIEFDVDDFINECHDLTTAVPEKEENMKSIEREIKCPECDSKEIYYTTSEIICKECGIVIRDKLMETRHGWRIFNEEDKRKIHGEIVKDDDSLTTKIPSWMGKDCHGYSLSPKMNYKMRRLAEIDRRKKQTKEERILHDASNYIRILCSKLSLSDQVKREAIISFKKYVKKCLKGNLKGKSIEYLSIAMIYKVCKELKVPFKIDEIARLMNINAKKIRSNYNEIISNTKEVIMSSPFDYIPRFASKMNVDGNTTSLAYKIIKQMMEHEKFNVTILGKQVMGYSAAALYLACIIKGVKPMRDRDAIAEITKIAESTIKKRAEEIVKLLNIDINYYYNKNYNDYIVMYKNRFKK